MTDKPDAIHYAALAEAINAKSRVIGQVRKPKGRSKSPKSSDNSTDVKVPALVPQPHGGAIRAGGTPGNRGGSGRPPNEIRARFRHHLDAELIEACLDDWRSGKVNALQVAEFFAKHALPSQTESYNAEEGREMILKFIGRMCEAAHRDGISKEQVDRWHAYAVEGIT